MMNWYNNEGARSLNTLGIFFYCDTSFIDFYNYSLTKKTQLWQKCEII